MTIAPIEKSEPLTGYLNTSSSVVVITIDSLNVGVVLSFLFLNLNPILTEQHFDDSFSVIGASSDGMVFFFTLLGV